jgi:hypothetical protein
MPVALARSGNKEVFGELTVELAAYDRWEKSSKARIG